MASTLLHPRQRLGISERVGPEGVVMSASLVQFDEKLLIPDLLRAAPQSRAVLDRYGLRGCGGPMGPVETLGFFAKAHDVPLPRLLAELEEAAHAAPPAPTPVD